MRHKVDIPSRCFHMSGTYFELWVNSMVEKFSLKVRCSAFVAMLWMTNYVSGAGLQNLRRLNFVHRALPPANNNLSLLLFNLIFRKLGKGNVELKPGATYMARASKDPASSRLEQKMGVVLLASLQGRQRRVFEIYIYIYINLSRYLSR